jgi:hypothetical protein
MVGGVIKVPDLTFDGEHSEQELSSLVRDQIKQLVILRHVEHDPSPAS